MLENISGIVDGDNKISLEVKTSLDVAGDGSGCVRSSLAENSMFILDIGGCCETSLGEGIT